MKTQNLLRLSLLILSSAIVSYSFAQDTPEYEIAKTYSKTDAAPYGVIHIGTNKKANNMNIKVQRSFVSHFKNAEDVSWEMLGDDFLVTYKTNNASSRALFSKQGALLYNIHYGTDKDLPQDVYQQVRSKYFDYQVTYAIQVTIDKQVIYVVSLKEKNNYLVLKVHDGAMNVMQQYHE